MKRIMQTALALVVSAGCLTMAGCVVAPARGHVAYVAPARVWVPAHWHRGGWQRGHWR